MHDAVTTVIPGCKTPAQVDDNVSASELRPLSAATLKRAKEMNLASDSHTNFRDMRYPLRQFEMGM